MMDCGIYSLTFPNGQFYIGSSCKFFRRTRIHECELERGRHPNDRMQKTFNKYKVMEKKLILACRKDDLKFYEQLIIDGLKPSLNLSRNAYRPEMTPEVCAKISAAAKGRIRSPEAIKKAADANRGRKRSDEFRVLMSSIAQGRRNSPEARAKMSVSHTGKVLSAEHRAKISSANFKRWEKRRKARDSHQLGVADHVLKAQIAGHDAAVQTHEALKPEPKPAAAKPKAKK